MPNLNLLQLEASVLTTQLAQAVLINHTKAQSWQMGRRLYQCKLGQQQYWLKTQLKHSHAVLEQNYLKELTYYQQAVVETLDYCIVEPWQDAELYHPYLMLPHAPLFFAVAPSELTLAQIYTKINQSLDYLHRLHRAGHLHADLKHEHFVQWQDKLYLIDFEQSMLHTEQQQHLNATPRYMAPELFHAQPKTIQTEIYALGIILYEWLTQTRLAAQNYHQWAYLHCQELKIQLPQAYFSLQKLLEGMLAKHFQQRFSSFGEIKMLLNA